MSERVVLKPGATVAVGERQYSIAHVLDLETVLVHDRQSGDTKLLKVSELAPVGLPSAARPLAGEADLVVIADTRWQIAQTRFHVLRPLLAAPEVTRAQVAECARRAGVHIATVYRWLQRYQQSGRVTALMPSERSGGRGHGRLRSDVEAIVQATVEEVYLSKPKPSVQHTCLEVLRRCRNAGLRPPHPNTVRSRIRHLSEKVRRHRREGGRAAAKDTSLYGKFPGAEWPLAVVQIDHTPVDLIVVDDIHRRPVGRPWLTLAIDVFSRVVVEFYVSFDPPGALAVGLCLAHAILPKETWLAQHTIVTPWPVWGVMDVVHADNAQEFRGRMIRKACAN